MAAPASIALCRPALHATLWIVACTLAGPLLTGCDRESGEHPRQLEGIRADLDEARRKVSHLQNSLATKDAELAANTQALEAARGGMSDLEKVVDERNAQLRAAKVELEGLKKKDILAFGEIAATQGDGSNALAVARYKKFIIDYPKSPLVLHANNAIAQLTEVQREVHRQTELVDPAKKEKDFARNFSEGYMTLQELAPYLKKKTVAQVVGLIGRPNQTFNEGNEFGYPDRAISPATGTRGMLIVSFESGVVATLRVEYARKEVYAVTPAARRIASSGVRRRCLTFAHTLVLETSVCASRRDETRN